MCCATTLPSPASRASSLLESTKPLADQAQKDRNLREKPPSATKQHVEHLPARLHAGDPAAACRRKRPCHGCLRCVIVSVTLQIPFPGGGPGGVINRGGGEVRTLPINRPPSPAMASPQRLERRRWDLLACLQTWSSRSWLQDHHPSPCRQGT